MLITTTDLDPETFGRSDDEIVGDAARMEVQGHSDGEGESGGAPAVRLSHEERSVGLAQENFQRQVPVIKMHQNLTESTIWIGGVNIPLFAPDPESPGHTTLDPDPGPES